MVRSAEEEVEVLHPDVVYPALEKPATELERLVVEYLMSEHGKVRKLPLDAIVTEARHRRLIP